MTSTVDDISAETLIDLVDQVWSSYLAHPVTVDPVTPATGVDSSVTATVSITGAWNGHVVVCFSAAGARAVCSAMLDLPAHEVGVDDTADAVGEIVNMVGGNVKAVLPEPSALGLPQVTIGAERVVMPGAVPAQSVSFRWQEHLAVVSVWSASSPEVAA